MYRGTSVLIFHQNQGAREELKLLFEETMEGIRVDIASYVAEAKTLVEATSYDVVVVNRLRIATRLIADSDTICEQIGLGLVIHLIGYRQYQMSDHLGEAHTNPGQPYGVCIDHLSVAWPTEVVKRIQGYLASWLIRGQLNELFGPDPRDRAAVRSPFPSSRSYGLTRHGSTHDLARICRWTMQSWKFLDKPLQDRIRRSFLVKETAEGVIIGRF